MFKVTFSLGSQSPGFTLVCSSKLAQFEAKEIRIVGLHVLSSEFWPKSSALGKCVCGGGGRNFPALHSPSVGLVQY